MHSIGNAPGDSRPWLQSAGDSWPQLLDAVSYRKLTIMMHRTPSFGVVHCHSSQRQLMQELCAFAMAPMPRVKLSVAGEVHQRTVQVTTYGALRGPSALIRYNIVTASGFEQSSGSASADRIRSVCGQKAQGSWPRGKHSPESMSWHA